MGLGLTATGASPAAPQPGEPVAWRSWPPKYEHLEKPAQSSARPGSARSAATDPCTPVPRRLRWPGPCFWLCLTCGAVSLCVLNYWSAFLAYPPIKLGSLLFIEN